jgi:hypothetical protein
MRRLNKSRTDDNGLVDIRASSPYRADFLDAVGATLLFESTSKDVSGHVLLHQIKGVNIYYVRRV